MKIHLDQVSKRYGQQWIIKNISYQYDANGVYGIAGKNGSGKSTLLKLISGFLTPSYGSIQYSKEGQPIERDHIYKFLQWVAPYIDLIKDFTLKEYLSFIFKSSPNNLNELISFFEASGFSYNDKKRLSEYSTGMLQRIKIGTAFLLSPEVILLDEPSSNMDSKGISWLESLVHLHKQDRLIIIASNEENELNWCKEKIEI